MKQISLSVFFPAYNEEKNLKDTVIRAIDVLRKIANEWEIIIVNDGSTDETREIADRLSKEDKRIRVMSHVVNKGYGEALKTGFREAKYPWVAFTDSDGQFDFSEVEKLIKKTKEADFILGYRLHRADSISRRAGTLFWNLIARILLGLSVKDYSCGFKLIRKSAYEKTLPLALGEKVTQIEMLVRAKRLGLKFSEIGVHHYPRRFGQQTGANIKVIAKSFIDLFKLWWNIVDKKTFFAVLATLLVAAFLRLYKIDEYMTFLGDEGRDVVLVRRLLVNFDPILIGPGTSIGNMYLGPLYYYMMAPAMLLSGLSPVGPAVGIAILGVLTVWFVYKIGSEWFGRVAGLVAAALYAVSPVVINYSHSSWNPNIMPFFALLSIYSIWRVWRHHEWKWLLVLGVASAFVLQSHYLGLLLVPVIALFLLLTLLKIRNLKLEIRNYVKNSALGLGIFTLLMSPLVIFDARHGWRNFEAMKVFFTNRQETVSLRPWNALSEIWPIWHEKFIERFMGGMVDGAGIPIALFLVLGILILIVKRKAGSLRAPGILLAVWIFVGLLGLGLYKQNIYDHYFGFMFAAPFLLFGATAGYIWQFQQRKFLRAAFLVAIIWLVLLNLRATPIRDAPQRQLQRTQEVAQKIAGESGGKPLNLAVLAERNYEDAYQYFLEWWKLPVRDIDPLRYEETVANQLFVVCELPSEKCDPTHSAKAEVTVFGWSKIDGEWDVAGVKLYKLGHNPSGKPQ